VLICNFLQAFFTPILEDEAYYWVWSQNLSIGYFDHPPMVAWWISLGYSLFQNELGVRLLTVLMSGLGIYFLWKTLEPKTQRQFNLFTILTLSVVVFQVFGFITTPDAPLLFFTILYIYLLQRFTQKTTIGSALWLGFAMAGLLYSKYHGVLVVAFTLIPYLIQHKKYFKPLLYAGGFAFALYLPHIIWLILNDFTPIRYHFMERSSDESFEFKKLFNYLGMYLFGMAPLLSFAVWKSLLKVNIKTAFTRSIWLLATVPGAFFFVSIFKDNVQPQWLLISFVAMYILTYWNYEDKLNLKRIYGFGIANILLIVALRIVLVMPSVSPFEKNRIFAQNIAEFEPINPIFEKYQEASLYKFHNPESPVAVHRTLGNRKSQYDLWNSEESYFGQTVTYISPWVKAEESFIGFKNRPYYLKVIEDYNTAQNIEIKTLNELVAGPNENINLGIKITNHHDREIIIGNKSNLKFAVTYYQEKQHQIVYSQVIEMSQITLSPDEKLDIQISYPNIDQAGNYKVCVGINNSQVGTTYLSKPFDLIVK